MIKSEKFTMRSRLRTGRKISSAFSLIELLITVSIIGILAAIVLPTFQANAQETKESAAKDNLRILRNAIELYAAQHNGVPPGYLDDDPSLNPSQMRFYLQMTLYEKYLNKIPENPFNGLGYPRIKMIDNAEEFPAEATGSNGWIYKPATKEIRLDWPGTDSAGKVYFNY